MEYQTQPTAHEIREESLHNKFFQMPNIIDFKGLSVYAFRLYCHYKRVAGDEGICWQSVETISEQCNMSQGMVTKARKELEDSGLILINRSPSHNGSDLFVISIADIWDENRAFITPKGSPHEPKGSLYEPKGSPHETNKTPNNKTLVNNTNTSYSENKNQFSDDNIPLNEEKIDDLSPSNDSNVLNLNTKLNVPRPEPIREPCDMDGITESMNLGYGGVKKKGLPADVTQFANAFVELAGVKFPRIENGAKDYKRYNATWWTPIKDMLYEVDGDVQVAIDILGRAMDSLSKIDKMPAMPKQVINTYITEIAKGKRVKPKETYLDPYGNVVEI